MRIDRNRPAAKGALRYPLASPPQGRLRHIHMAAPGFPLPTIVIFDEHSIKQAEKHLKRGSKVLAVGAMETRKFEKDGQDHYMTEIVLRPYGGGSLTLVDDARSEN